MYRDCHVTTDVVVELTYGWCDSCDITHLQRALSGVSAEEWVNIPEVGDARNKKQRNAHIRPDRYTPLPDSVLAQGFGTGTHTTLDSRQQVCPCGMPY